QRHIMRERCGPLPRPLRYPLYPGKDGKLRYDQTLRQEMFSWIIGRFKTHNPKWKIFLCMETPDVWVQSAMENPFKNQDLKELFDTQVLRAHSRQGNFSLLPVK
ncbi:MAG: hypothetical protein KDD22_02495, partial [Bdellovibrionales bacterium]|nr:hypothetical protein [Bdellovibrionales bacterium]